MNLSDRIKLTWKVNAILIDNGEDAFVTDTEGNELNIYSERELHDAYDDELNPIELTEIQQELKCKIIPNSSAKKVTGNDGLDYVYSYEVYMRMPKNKDLIPRENQIVHITKKDGTIDCEPRCIGFVTLRNWVRLWLQ